MMLVKILKQLFRTKNPSPQSSGQDASHNTSPDPQAPEQGHSPKEEPERPPAEQETSKKAAPDGEALENLELQWELLSSKRKILHKEYFFETRLDERFRLKHILDTIEAQQREIARLLNEAVLENLRQVFQEKQQKVEQELIALEQQYEQLKKQVQTGHTLTEAQAKEHIRQQHLIEELEEMYNRIEEELHQLQLQHTKTKNPSIAMKIREIEEQRRLLNEKLQHLHQQ